MGCWSSSLAITPAAEKCNCIDAAAILEKGKKSMKLLAELIQRSEQKGLAERWKQMRIDSLMWMEQTSKLLYEQEETIVPVEEMVKMVMEKAEMEEQEEAFRDRWKRVISELQRLVKEKNEMKALIEKEFDITIHF